MQILKINLYSWTYLNYFWLMVEIIFHRSHLHIAFGSIMFSIMTGGIVGVSALAPRSISLCAMGNILLIMHKKTMLYVQAGYLNNGPYMYVGCSAFYYFCKYIFWWTGDQERMRSLGIVEKSPPIGSPKRSPPNRSPKKFPWKVPSQKGFPHQLELFQ